MNHLSARFARYVRTAIAVCALAIGLGGLLAPALAFAAPETPQSVACDAIVGADSNNCTTQPSNGVSVDHLLSLVVNILAWIVGVIAVIMVIVAGFRFITAGGDSNKVSSARGTIINALIGLAVVALAETIVHFVLSNL